MTHIESSKEKTIRLFPHLTYPYASYGLPFPDACAKQVKTDLGCKRAYLICSGSLASKTDAVTRLTNALGQDCVVGVKVGLKQHGLHTEVWDIVEEVKRLEADIVVTIGGGTLVDAAKTVVFAITNEVSNVEDLAPLMKSSMDLFSKFGPPTADKPWPGPIVFRQTTIPIVCITTTLSSGEWSQIGCGYDHKTFLKQLFWNPTFPGPSVMIWDPELTLHTPSRLWLGSGVRLIDHCVEGYCSPKADAEQQGYDIKGFKLIVSALLRTQHDHGDLEARLNALRGSMEAMKPVKMGNICGASHGIGHQLGPLGVPHGETSCVLLPAVLKYNKTVNNDVQEQLLREVWKDETTKGVLGKRGLKEGVADLGDVVDAVVRELGMPRSLKEVGIGRDKLETIAVNSLKDACCQINPIKLERKEQVLEILETCVGDSSLES